VVDAKVFSPFTVGSPMVKTENCSIMEPKHQLNMHWSGDFENDNGAVTHLSSVLQPTDSLNLQLDVPLGKPEPAKEVFTKHQKQT
jgi:hypothetical protein